MPRASCTCGHIACVCDIKEQHDKGCKLRGAAACPIPIACMHGYDVCPICDPCTCGPVEERFPYAVER